jgi:hypothetical protein
MECIGQEIEKDSVVNKNDQYNGACKFKKRNEFLIGSDPVVIIVEGKIKEADEVDEGEQPPQTTAGPGWRFWDRRHCILRNCFVVHNKIKECSQTGEAYKSQ